MCHSVHVAAPFFMGYHSFLVVDEWQVLPGEHTAVFPF